MLELISGKMVESKKALPKETRPNYYGSYGPPFAAAAAMAMAAAAAVTAVAGGVVVVVDVCNTLCGRAGATGFCHA